MTTTALDARAAWLADRKTVITGTDAAKVMGLSKWGSPMDVYLDKLGLLDEESDTAPKMAGRRFERTILEWYADDQDANIVFEPPFYLRKSPTLANVGATLDALRYDGIAPHYGMASHSPVDAKNLRFSSAEWGEPGSDVMPLYYATQLVLQMHVVDAPFADLAVVFSGQDFMTYRLYRDAEIEANIVGACQAFWDTHVAKRIPPPVDGSEAYATYLKKMIRQATDEVKVAPPDLDQIASALASVRRAIEGHEADKTLHENIIKAFIGEAKKVQGTNWSATWSQAKDGRVRDMESILGNLRAALALRGDGSELLSLMDECIERHTTTRPGARSFRFTAKGL